ncbi:alpha/beta fold hydrolase [Roseovarius spongiae]|uniref:Alpha/beta fold hydrolase n=1 Tax=Roseovarius spongiae TaxID=2320272 RepID=A0A3A8AVK8_9RHOB|nr:alpha/beta fold hydrolase [Roseovarius spongiae]RKF15168.1 alpha/beta fold hydrolase [Roseovarius spongiae]
MIYRFADCSIDTGRHRFTRGGATLHLEPQVFALLAELAQAGGALVSKDRLIETVWQGLAVSDATISARISAARAALGDTGRDQRLIRTVPKRGIQLLPEVTTDAPAPIEATGGGREAPPIRFTQARDGATIAHSVSGSGPPLLRAGHWLSHLELDWRCPVWQPFLTRLGGDFTLCRYDQRGTGLSGRDLENVGVGDFADDLRAVADAARLDRFSIFAASQAVPVAIRFAARHPERVSRMVLYGGYAKGRSLRPKQPGDIDEETMLGLIRAGWGQADSAFFRAFVSLFMPDGTPEQVASFARVQSQSITPENAARLRRAVDRFDVADDLDRVRAPVLVVHARGDAIQPIAQGQLIASRIPDAEFMMLDSRNHVPLPQEPCWTQLMDAVSEFCLRAE